MNMPFSDKRSQLELRINMNKTAEASFFSEIDKYFPQNVCPRYSEKHC